MFHKKETHTLVQRYARHMYKKFLKKKNKAEKGKFIVSVRNKRGKGKDNRPLRHEAEQPLFHPMKWIMTSNAFVYNPQYKKVKLKQILGVF